MAEFSSLPLFTDAWMADTAHLDHLDRGIYMDLIILMWRSPRCQVVNDLGWIARKLRLEDAPKRKILENLINEFCERSAGYVLQKRLRREYEYVRDKRDKNKRSAKLRWEKEKGVCEGNAPSPTPSPTSIRDNKLFIGRAPRSSRKQGVRLDPAWEPNSEGRALAVARLGEKGAIEELAKFRDYWTARAGAGAAKLDWDATWRNWVRNAKGTTNGSGRISQKERYGELLRSLTSEDGSEDAAGGIPLLNPKRP